MPERASRIGRMLRGVRAGERKLAWFRPELQAPETLTVTSPAFAHRAHMPAATAGRGVGGNVSPALAWAGVPTDAATLLLIVEDYDVPLPRPVVHARVEGIAPQTGALAEGGIPSWRGPRPVPGHGPHHYVFQLFALDPAGGVLARGRLIGVYERD